MDYDLFISYASEDQEFVRPLAERFRSEGYLVWYDKFELRVGDSLTAKIDYGLSHSSAGVVILSPAFMKKQWPRRELSGLVSRQLHENARVLPVWHGVGLADVITYSPPLADLKAVNSSASMDEIVREVKKVVSPSGQDPRTIEEAVELLERGAVEISGLVAARALDERLCDLVRHNLDVPRVDVSGPQDALQLLLEQRAVVTNDSGGAIDIEMLRGGLSLLQPTFEARLPS